MHKSVFLQNARILHGTELCTLRALIGTQGIHHYPVHAYPDEGKTSPVEAVGRKRQAAFLGDGPASFAGDDLCDAFGQPQPWGPDRGRATGVSAVRGPLTTCIGSAFCSTGTSNGSSARRRRAASASSRSTSEDATIFSRFST